MHPYSKEYCGENLAARVALCNDLRWVADDQASALSLPHNPASHFTVAVVSGWKCWLVRMRSKPRCGVHATAAASFDRVTTHDRMYTVQKRLRLACGQF